MNPARHFSADTLREAWTHSDADSADERLQGARAFVPKVLFVDDEPRVLDGLRRALSDDAYRIHTATSADAALQKLCQESFDVVVADERMPGMSGSELLAIIASEFPLTARILLTGQATVEAASRAVNEAGIVRFLLKPCNPGTLRQALESALRVTPFEKRNRPAARQRKTRNETRESARRASARLELAGGASDSLTAAIQQEQHARNAAEASSLVLEAQKVVELGNEGLFGYELATRLQMSGGNIRTVGNVVASSGPQLMFAAVDRWVLRHVLKWIYEHHAMLERDGLTVSLNVAAQSLADPEFARFLDKELVDARIASRFLIEVREAALAKCLRTDDGLLARLLKLRCYESGARLCIDGVSGALWKLAVLKNLPVALAKIDSRFVCNILTNPQSEALIRAAVEWGQRCGVEIAASGIDTRAIVGRLSALGVRYGQGTFFGTQDPTGLTLTHLYS